MTQQALFEEQDVDERTPPDDYGSQSYWRHFSPDTPPAEARQEFMRIYGRPPAQVLRVPNMLLAGPVPAPGAEPRQEAAR